MQDYPPYAEPLAVYQRDELVIAPPLPYQRVPKFETTVTLVHCDRWVKQDTSTMYRREERSAL